MFEKLLTQPNYRDSIQLCLHFGSSFYQVSDDMCDSFSFIHRVLFILKKNADGIFPLVYAIESLCADNLKAILKYSDESVGPNFDEIEHLLIFNQKLAGRNNFLHLLVDRLSDENYEEVSEVIKVLLRNGCNLNLLNDQMKTPFQLLLEKLETIEHRKDLFKSFTENATICLNNGIIQLMKKQNLWNENFLKNDEIVDFALMLKLLKELNEDEFMEQFERYQRTVTADSRTKLVELLNEAIIRNFDEITKLLLDKGADVNGNSSHEPSAFLACKLGHHEVLKVLLERKDLQFKHGTTERSLLSEICSNVKIHDSDRQKCFDDIISDPRCTLTLVNSMDDNGQTPLHHAVTNGLNEIVKELLRRGAYIGHDAVIDSIEEQVLQEFLDDSIRCQSELNDRNCEIHIDYRFLTPQNSCQEPSLEIRPIYEISRNPKLHRLILHPVISSFLELKWKKINFIVYFNLLVYFSFMMFLGCFMITFFHHNVYSTYNFDVNDDVIFDDRSIFDDSQELEKPADKPNILSILFGFSSGDDSGDPLREKRSIDFNSTDTPGSWNKRFHNHFHEHKKAYIFCVIGVVLITIYEIIQFARSFKTYLLKLSNWFDIALICLSFFVLLGSFDLKPESFKQVRAIAILIMAAQTIQLIGKVSFLSMSLHMAIFKKVSTTFFKTFALYLIQIIAFAMSFYTLYDEDPNPNDDLKLNNSEVEEKQESFANPFVSMISIVRMMLSDFGQIDIKPTEHFQGLVFLLFVSLITVVLFNLLNALAISDTADMMKDAERVDTKKRITILYSYEKFLSMFNFTFACILPEVSRISIMPNKSYSVKVQSVFRGENQTNSKQNSSLAERFASVLRRKLNIWKKGNKNLEFSCKIVKKIVDFVELRNEKESIEIEKQMTRENAKNIEEIRRILNLSK